MRQATKIFDNFQALVDAIVSEGDEYKATADMIKEKGEEFRNKEDGEKYMSMKWVGVFNEGEEGKVSFIPMTPDMIAVPREVADMVTRPADRATRRRLERKYKKISKTT